MRTSNRQQAGPRNSNSDFGWFMTMLAVGVLLMVAFLWINAEPAMAVLPNPADQAVTVGGGRPTYPILNQETYSPAHVRGSNGGESPYAIPSMMYLNDRLGMGPQSGVSVVYITKRSQLTVMSGDTNGASVFWMQPGYFYAFDPVAVAMSDGSGASVAGVTSIKTFTGVTFFQPPGNAENAGKVVGLGIVLTKVTGYASVYAGATPAYVFPFPGNTGLTVFGKPVTTYAAAYRSSNTPYTMERSQFSLTSGVSRDISSGNSATDWSVNRLGEYKFWRLSDANAQVSAWALNPTSAVSNDTGGI